MKRIIRPSDCTRNAGCKTLAGTILCGLIALPVHASDWINGDGDWQTAAKWNGGVPTATTDANFVPATLTSYTVRLVGHASARSVLVGNPVNFSGSVTFNLAGFDLTSTSTSPSANLGLDNFTGGSLTLSNSVAANDPSTFTASVIRLGAFFPPYTAVGGRFQVTSGVTLNYQRLSLFSGYNLTVSGVGARAVQTSATDNTTIDTGTLTIEAGGEFFQPLTGGSAASLLVRGGTVNLTGGSMQVRQLSLVQSFTGLAHMNVTGGMLTIGSISDGTINFVRGTISTTTISASQLTEFSNSLNLETGAAINASGAVVLDESVVIAGGSLTAGSLQNPGGGSVAMTSGALSITGGGLSIGPGSPVGPNLSMGRGTVTASGALSVAAGGKLSADGGSLTVASATNDGRMNLVDATANFGSGLLNRGVLNVIDSTITGGVTHQGPAMIAIAGEATFAGAVSGSGNFEGSGKAVFSGGYSPGASPAAVSFGGAVAFTPGNLLVLEIGGTTAGTGYDQLNIAGALTLGGGLEVKYLNGFTPQNGQSFDLLNATTFSGSFDSLNLPALAPGLAWDTGGLSTAGVLVVVPEPTAALNALMAFGLLALRRCPKKAR